MMRDPNRNAGCRSLRSGIVESQIRHLAPDEQGRRSWTTVHDPLSAQRPLSAVLWDFSAPLLGPPETWEPHAVDNGLEFAVGIWNAVVLEQHRGDAGPLLELRKSVAGVGGDEGVENLRQLEALRRTKIERYGPDARLIVGHMLSCDDSDYNLRVAIWDLSLD